MTMTDDDLDRALRTLGEQLDAAGAARRVRAVRPAPTRSTRTVVLVLTAAAAALALAGLAVRQPDRDPEPLRPASTAGDEPTLPAVEVGPVAAVCAESARAMAASFAIPDRPPGLPELPDPDASEVVVAEVPSTPSQVAVLLIDGELGYACIVPEGANTTARVDGRPFGIDDPAPPPADGLAVIDLAGSGSEAVTGPGEITVVGRIGDDVRSVTVRLADGAEIAGGVADGFVVVHGRVGRDVPLFELEVEWTLEDGSVRSAPVDSLDRPDELERCAADETCRTERLDRLVETITARSDVLDDGTISDADLVRLRREWVGCGQDAGYPVTISEDGQVVQAPAVEIDPATGEPATGDPNRDLELDCPSALLDAASDWQRLTELAERDG